MKGSARDPVESITLFAAIQKAAPETADLLPCPRCGRYTMSPQLHTNALSRQFGISVCDECGTDEALAVMANNPLRPEDWAVAISQREVYPEVLQGED